MKELYKSYNKRTPTELKQLWTGGLITFDTNILFDLYRHSEYLTELFFKTANQLKDRIFLTNHVGLEYHRKRYDIINQSISLLNERIREVNEFENAIQKLTYYKYFSDDLKKGINSEVQKFKTKIEERKKVINKLDSKDTIYSRLHALFENKVEDEFSKEEMESIFLEGEKRYAAKIPPGFEDKEKEKDGTFNNAFGDLVIWKEILRKSKRDLRPVIFVTNEKKSDWIWKLSDKKIVGPRPELLTEMLANSNMDFSISNFQNFFLSSNELLNNDLDQHKLKAEFVFESIFENSVSYFEEQNQIKRKQREEKLTSLLKEHGRLEARIIELSNKPDITPNEFAELERSKDMFEALKIELSDTRKSYGK